MSDQTGRGRYPDVDSQPNFPDLEREILESWNAARTFARSVEARESDGEYVFYDGPPFANGLPHYGHLLTGYVKDIVPRYQTMRGHRVERRFGWDCHGLPAEMEVEKELGVSGRAQIQVYGIGRFNDQCRSSVMRYAEDWEQYVTRQARWVDFQNDYKTMDLSYMESVMWAFKQLYDKGWIYEGLRVLPYSWAAETPLSNFETRLDDSYRERQDPAVTVRFAIRNPGPEDPTEVWAWTTTPWTLPSNLAIAVGGSIDYAILQVGDARIAVAEAARERYPQELGEARHLATRRGETLVGLGYEPLFPFFADTANAFQILADDYVSTEDGTGMVHQAPGFGEDDMRVTAAAGIPVIVPVDEKGCFTDEVPPWSGTQVLEANPSITRALREQGSLVRHDTIVHSYPHCWRTDQPLIYRAMSSWYVSVSKFAPRMVELNRDVKWIPEHIRDGRFGKWLEGAQDWSISRNRFWGSPIPVWKSDNPDYPRLDVYGSLDELARDFGARPTDLHRPAIDELVRPNPDDPSGRSMMRRVPDVLDCWFESGSMPFAQVHYPFENREFFDAHFPSDFVVEYIAQTRGWFYTLMVLGTALFDRPPFKTVMCHGVVLDEDGQKLSKRLKNYPDPLSMFETHGSDALRWFLVSSPILRGNDLRVDREGKAIGDIARTVLLPFWNAYSFFTLYANIDGAIAKESTEGTSVIDRYLLAKTRRLVEDTEDALDRYDLGQACAYVEGFLDALTNWYIRRSRERFWRSGLDDDKRAAYDTLFTSLTVLARVTAPLLPFVSEAIYRGLTDQESVHLADWPSADALPRDDALVATMDRTRDVCSTARTLREREGIRVRQPLRSLTLAGAGTAALEAYRDLIADEVNVKEVIFSESIEAWARFELQVNARVLGPRLGGAMKGVLAAAKRGEWETRDDGGVRVGEHDLAPEEYQLRLKPNDGATCLALPKNDAVVILDTELSDELIAEGIARDVVRGVQQARKDAGLHVADRVVLRVSVPDDWRDAAQRFRDWIAGQTLADTVEIVTGQRFENRSQFGDHEVSVDVRRTGDQ